MNLQVTAYIRAPFGRLSLLYTLLLTLSACGGGNSSPTTPSSPAPAPTFTISGLIRESAPTELVPVADARIEVTDGQFAGRSATTGSNGQYTLTGLSGTVNLRVSKEGYESKDQGVNISQNRSADFHLPPTFRVVSETAIKVFQDGKGEEGCSTSGRPCYRINWPVHNDGAIQVRAVWSDYSQSILFQGLFTDWISISLTRAGEVIGSASTNARYPNNADTAAAIRVDGKGGATFELEIAYLYYSLRRRTITVQLDTARPN